MAKAMGNPGILCGILSYGFEHEILCMYSGNRISLTRESDTVKNGSIKAISLQSGSNGNCFYVEAEDVRLLFDAGISGIQAQKRLEEHGRDIRDVQALIISHDHSDHARSAGIFNRKYKIPVYMTLPTYQRSDRSTGLGQIGDLRHFDAGQTLDFGPVTVETIPTPHDAVDGVGFVICAGGRRLGVLTDLGHVFDGLDSVVASLDAVFLESNYDPGMLKNGPYPPFLKNRISGRAGHISNSECAELVSVHGSRLRWACLSHLSEQNNSPEIALATSRRILGDSVPIHVASRYGVSHIFEIPF
jgi:phosphoribosyl 1,2-cyclic phosphodiesterase